MVSDGLAEGCSFALYVFSGTRRWLSRELYLASGITGPASLAVAQESPPARPARRDVPPPTVRGVRSLLRSTHSPAPLLSLLQCAWFTASVAPFRLAHRLRRPLCRVSRSSEESRLCLPVPVVCRLPSVCRPPACRLLCSLTAPPARALTLCRDSHGRLR